MKGNPGEMTTSPYVKAVKASEASQEVFGLTSGHQFDLPADGGHLISGQAAHRQRALQVTKHDLGLQVVVLVKARVHGDLGGVDGKRHPGRGVVGAAEWGRWKRDGASVNGGRSVLFSRSKQN